MLHQDSHLVPGNAVEIVGKVNQDLTVKVLKATDMGSNLGAFFGRRGI
jgi:replication factor A3